MGIKPDEEIITTDNCMGNGVELSAQDVAQMMVLLANELGYQFVGDKYEYGNYYASIRLQKREVPE